MRWLIRLYPKEWQHRYGEEFLALLEEQQISPRVVFDVLLGAIDAHLRPQISVDKAQITAQTAAVTGGLAMAPIGTRLSRVDRPALFGVVFLVPASIFLLMLTLKLAEMKLGLGVGGPYDAFHTWSSDPAYNSNPDYALQSFLLNVVGRTLVALGPIFALVIGVLSQVRLRLRVEKGSLIGAVSMRGGLINVAVVTISALFSAALVFLGVTQAALDWVGIFSFSVFH